MKKSNLYLVIGVIIIIIIFLLAKNSGSNNNSNVSSTIYSTPTYERKIREIDNVRKWYSNNVSSINKSFLELLKNNAVSGTISYSTQLKFDGDLGVYYIVNYSNGIKNSNYVSGHARAFVKYLDTNIQWFSLEIGYDNDPVHPVVDWYKDEYDGICENYYYELIEKYG